MDSTNTHILQPSLTLHGYNLKETKVPVELIKGNKLPKLRVKKFKKKKKIIIRLQRKSYKNLIKDPCTGRHRTYKSVRVKLTNKTMLQSTIS